VSSDSCGNPEETGDKNKLLTIGVARPNQRLSPGGSRVDPVSSGAPAKWNFFKNISIFMQLYYPLKTLI
jgi:hypothetical protein